MKKRLLTLLTSAVGIVALSACGPNTVDSEVKTYDFDGLGYVGNEYFAVKEYSYNLAVGGSKAISLESLPASYNEGLIFVSKDPSIVTVSEAGIITGVKKGFTDVEISSKDGAVSEKVKVTVSETASKEAAQSTINAINAKYNDSSYVAPKKVLRHEYSSEFYLCEGVVDHGNKSLEAMAYDSEQGYFYVDGPYLTYKVPYGQPEVSNGKWLFYTINQGLYVRMVHITSSARNYYDLNTSLYTTNDEAIKAVLDIFFVSGRSIIENCLESYSGKEDFEQFSRYSGSKFSLVGDDSLYITYDEANSGEVVDADDELNYYDIYADTVYSYTYHQESLFANNLCQALTVDMTMSYKYQDKNWERKFIRSQYYESDFEISKVQDPKNNGYKLVESIYDL